jgi:hypothetical protein
MTHLERERPLERAETVKALIAALPVGESRVPRRVFEALLAHADVEKASSDAGGGRSIGPAAVRFDAPLSKVEGSIAHPDREPFVWSFTRYSVTKAINGKLTFRREFVSTKKEMVPIRFR